VIAGASRRIGVDRDDDGADTPSVTRVHEARP
jgi:hypothetical protein